LKDHNEAELCRNFGFVPQLEATMTDPDGARMDENPQLNAIERLSTTIESISSHLIALNDRMERRDQQIMVITHEISSVGENSMGKDSEVSISKYKTYGHKLKLSNKSYSQKLAKTDKNSSQEIFSKFQLLEGNSMTRQGKIIQIVS